MMVRVRDKVIDKIQPTTGRGKPSYCSRDGCKMVTREKKPFCSEHVEDHPYMQEVMSEIAARSDEAARVNKKGWKEVDVNGSIAREMLGILMVHQERAYVRFLREIDSLGSEKVTASYCYALRKAGLAHLQTNHRGTRFLRYGPKPE